MSETKVIDLSIVIVSYNTVDMIGDCLESVLAQTEIKYEIFVIENASTDGSLDYIQRHFPSVNLIVNTGNRGFAAANNQALRDCRGRFIFFLNPDTIVKPKSFLSAVSFMEEFPQIGLAGTKVINPDGSLQDSVSYRYPGEKYTTGELSGLKGPIACVLGASMIAHTEIVKKVGGFDESFFIYGEDQDLCLRVRQLGYEIGYIDSSVIIHLGGQSERTNTSAAVWGKKCQAENLFFHKHYLPQSIKKIRRADLIKAHWRILTLKATLPFMQNKFKAKEKLIKYETIRNFIHQAG